MIRKWIAKYLLVVQLLLLLLGAMLILLSTIPSASKQLSLALFSLGTAVMSSTFLSLVHSAFGTDIPTLVEQRLGFQRKVYDMGLEAIHLHIGDESIFDQFEHARSIDMMYNTARNATYRYGDRIAHAIATRGCRVRILVSDPENIFWKSEAAINGLCPATNIIGEIGDTISRLKLLMNKLKQHTPPLKAGSLEVKVYPCAPTCSILIVNDEIARHTPYLPFAHSSEVPIYDAIEERGGQLFAQYQDTFNRVWARSRTVLKVDFASVHSQE